MSDTTTLGFPDAARRLGVPLRVLRRAIRAGKIPAPPHLAATAILPAEWLASAQAVAKTSPGVLSRALTQKVPAFARYDGTSAWHKHRNRVRNFAHARAAAKRAAARA